MDENINVSDVSGNDIEVVPEIIPEDIPDPEVPEEELPPAEDVQDFLAGEEDVPEDTLPDMSEDFSNILNDTVSSGDSTVSGNDIIIGDYSDYGEALSEIHAELQSQNVPIWEKPIEDYTVTEGLLLCLVLIAISILFGKIFRGGEKYV